MIRKIYIKKKDGELSKIIRDPLYINSFFLILTTLFSDGFGYIFWLLAAKYYSQTELGIAAALLSSMGLILLLSRFGLDSSLIRFFPERDKSKIFNTSIITSLGLALFLGFIFVSGVDIWAQELEILKSPQGILYILILAAGTISSFTAVALIAIRETKIRLIQSIIIGSRVIFLIPLSFLGALGIFSSVGLSLVFSAFFALIFLRTVGIFPKIEFDKTFMRDSITYTTKNHICNILIIAPNFVLPILTLSALGPDETAQYYVSFIIASALFIIPNSISTSLFVEGSYGKSIRKSVLMSFFAILLILTPLVIFFWFAGSWILNTLDEEYGQSIELLRLIVVSSYFVTIFSLYASIRRIQKKMGMLTAISLVLFLMIMILSVLFMPLMGVNGLGYAWLVSYFTISIIILLDLAKEI